MTDGAIVTICGLAISTAISVGTMIWVNGRASGKSQAWMKGHEQLDQARFDGMALSIKTMTDNIGVVQGDIKKLLER